MPKSKDRLTHNVYVVELDPAVLGEKRFRDRNPGQTSGKPCVYVGLTGLAVADRFENHRRGHKSSRYAHRYGQRLLPALFAHLNPMPYAAAQQMEVDLATQLREQGFGVWQG